MPVLIWLFLFAGGILLAQSPEQVVRDSVESFCKLEFNGAQDPSLRAKQVRFSDSRLAEMKKMMANISPYVFEWQSSPLDVIESFEVIGADVSGATAHADVDYVVIAQREAWGAPIKSRPKTLVHSRLRLTQVGTRWIIIDPPYPRVSRTFLSASYRGQFQLPDTWYQQASRAQLLWLRNAIDNILLLDSADTDQRSR